jgi:hypothetical protein
MVELEVYAAGVRSPDKMMGLALELDTLTGLRYKVDTNHDIVYMEFSDDTLPVNSVKALFGRAGLDAKIVGALPDAASTKKKTQRLA